MTLIYFFITVFLPILLWYLFIRWQDASEREPRYLVRRCAYAGVGAVIIASIFNALFFSLLNLPTDFSIFSLEETITPSLLVAFGFFLIGPIEELTKYLALRQSVFFSKDFNQVFDGILYGITIALVFSFVENITYFIEFNATSSTPNLLVSSIGRSVFATLLHVTATGIIGYHLGMAKFSKKNSDWLIVKGIVYGSLLHGTYNVLVLGVFPGSGLVAILLLVSAFILFIRLWNTTDVRMVWRFVPMSKNHPPLVRINRHNKNDV